ncbi:FlgD immunoglobulin-like domain containing protein [Candidatus Poribacteria bacterium]
MKHFRQSVLFVWIFWLLLLGAWCYGAGEPIIKLGNGTISNAQFSPDQKYLAILGSVGVEILDAQTFEWVDALPGGVTIAALGGGDRNLVFSRDGQLLAVEPGRIWDMTEFRLVHTFPEHYGTFAFSHDGRFLAMGDTYRGREIVVCEVGKWEIIKRFPLPDIVATPTSVDISPDGRFIAAGFGGVRPPPDPDGEAGALNIWDFESQKQLYRRQPRGMVKAVEFNPAGTHLVYSGFELIFLEIGTWSVWGETKPGTRYPAGLAFDPETGNVASAYWNNVKFLNLEGELIQTFHGHTDYVRSISIRPDGKVMATTSQDGSAKLWNMETGEEIWHRDYSSPIAALSFRDNTVLLSCSDWTLNVREWLVTTGGWENILPATGPSSELVVFHPTEPVLAADSGRMIFLWDVSEGKYKGKIEVGGRPINHLSFSHDGAYLASAHWSNDAVRIINYEDMKIVSELEVRSSSAIALGPDGLIAIHTGSSTQLWDWENQTMEWAVPGVGRGGIALSPNGEFLLANEAVWNIPQEELRFRIDQAVGHQISSASVFSPDSRVLATIPRGEEIIKLWDVGNREIMETLSGAQNIKTLAFSPNGRLLAGSGDDGIIMVWQIDNSPSTAIETRITSLATWGGVKRSSLLQNYPNPFNPETWIPYQLAEDGKATITICNATGQIARTLDLGHKESGYYTIRWDGQDDRGQSLASGIYFYVLRTDDGFSDTKKMILLK